MQFFATVRRKDVVTDGSPTTYPIKCYYRHPLKIVGTPTYLSSLSQGPPPVVMRRQTVAELIRLIYWDCPIRAKDAGESPIVNHDEEERYGSVRVMHLSQRSAIVLVCNVRISVDDGFNYNRVWERRRQQC